MYRRLVIFSIFILSFTILHAQNSNVRFSAELTSGPSFAIGDLGGSRLKYGRGLDAILALDVYANVGLFGGWSTNSFSSEGLFNYRESGLMYGLQYKVNSAESPFEIIFRVGMLWNHLEATDRKESVLDDFYYDTDYSKGFYTSSGINYSIGRGWFLNCTVKYHLFTKCATLPEIIWPDGTPESEVIVSMPRNLSLNYVGVRIGIIKYF
ncbi:MAG: hypothetical protein A2X19_02090 [Bacteroidetes bacterium GWE2_39_28]|nr:MAG: hypothetical protein A2X19_02090 [Bacteroidetes bacterium GWE2_39_28]OFY12021.1 MAG: hypothetical protein A2X16_05720 [Bacteroidetes bacterium GWF2_39_10]OFZ07129.1 MAG: hypothetical protein A2322_02370 [Bacteroidetes bacterium RIFOXYB2_FULL_39_7]OFZ11276.1 MAG: hypothetical protein A2465_09070 [Bacteroidetes bacterium RIFOXYC2_FULL_39_11]HCT95125.1 hypothetical protein [Rikenellaceae bacterium]